MKNNKKKMFKKILIANRGEIAVRVIRACRELGVKCVAVYSEADRDGLHVKYADEAFCIGPSPAKDSYLNQANIISTAELLGVDAIHPGYGFFAEDAHFAQICAQCGIVFIGPPPHILQNMADKVQAKILAKKAGIPIIPGTLEPVRSVQDAQKIAKDLAYPVLLKAAGGGGGKGMRLVTEKSQLKKAFQEAQTEAKASFGSDDIYMESYISPVRHIEIQILADRHKNILTLGERECSLQRKNQKLLEETPSPFVDDALRKKLSDAAYSFVKSIGYENAGTVEFLVDAGKNYYFIEMNTRIQVEHTITERALNMDLVKAQIRVADGEKLGVRQGQTRFRGHAMQVRVNAEDPETFAPSPGTIKHVQFPGGPGVRVDTHIFAGSVISSFYDSLIAKVITRGQTREEAIARMKRALMEFEIVGVKTTIPFALKVLHHEKFVRGELHTRLVDEILEDDRQQATGNRQQ